MTYLMNQERMMNTVSRAIWITGAGGGIGSAIASYFLEKDETCHVWLGVRRSREKALELSSKFPQRTFLLNQEVTELSDWEAGLNEILEKSGRLDVLVNNAGGAQDGLLATMPTENWSSVIDSNLNAAFLGCKTVLPQMISQRFGRIVQIASLSALLSPAGQSNYAAAKAGLLGLSQSLAKEVARIGITVNSICPGYIDTEALKLGAEEKKRLIQSIPMRRFGKPAEVAATVYFIASPEAGYMTGAQIKLDGGIL